MTNASKIITTYYRPAETKISDSGEKHIILQITRFDEIHSVLEHRIAAWGMRALELAHCKNAQYTITKAISKKEAVTEIVYTWE